MVVAVEYAEGRLVNEGSESRVVNKNWNIKDCNRRIGCSTGGVKNRVEGVDKGEKVVEWFTGSWGRANTVANVPTV